MPNNFDVLGAELKHLAADLEERFLAHRREHDYLDKSIEAARNVVNYRLTELNNVKEQINSERGTFVSRATYDALHRDLENQIEALKLVIHKLVTKDELTAVNTTLGVVQSHNANINGRLWAMGISIGFFVTVFSGVIGYFQSHTTTPVVVSGTLSPSLPQSMR